MRMSKLFIAVIAGIIIIAVTTYPRQKVNSSDNILDKQVKAVNLEQVTAGQAALNTLLGANMAGGVAEVQDCSGQTSYTFTPVESSLRGILDSIVSLAPQYRWEIKDNVINFIPRDDELQFLAVHISKLDINQVGSPNEALTQLLATPEVQNAQRNLGPRSVQGGTYPFCPQCPAKEIKKFSVSLKNVTVREALNAIASAHGSAVWWLSQAQCGESKSFSIRFATKE
jgi:hypothetical protein